MLRITLAQGPQPSILKLEGKLSGPWVNELEHSWTEMLQSGLAPSVPVDLSDVTFISSEGKTLLKTMLQQGADLQSRSLLTQFILGQIKDESQAQPAARNGG
jgi:anti-anti-sigma regulatory factor